MSTHKPKSRPSLNQGLSKVARETCEELNQLLTNGVKGREQSQLGRADGSYGSQSLTHASLSDQEKKCIALLRKGLGSGQSEKVAEGNMSAVLSPKQAAVPQQAIKAARIRDKNRRAQQKYREKKKMRLAEMQEALAMGRKQLMALRVENQRLTGVGDAMRCSHNLRGVLMGKNYTKNAVENLISNQEPNKVDIVTQDATSMPHEDVSKITQRINEAKSKFVESGKKDIHAFKKNIIDLFWKLSSADCAGFLKLIAHGTVIENDEKVSSFKDMILSMVKGREGFARSEAMDALESLTNGLEKLTFHSGYMAARVSSADFSGCRTQFPSSLLLHVSQASVNCMREYVSLYSKLEHIFDPEQYARLWIESPTYAVPDALQILCWVSESKENADE